MVVQEKSFIKLCSFYVSDWHLVTMLLPYINKKINEQAKIATILEKDIEENIITLLQKLNLKNKEKIEKINWKKQQNNKIFEDIENSNIKNGEQKELIIIINGREKFIKEKNKKIEEYLKTHNTNKIVKIINCYEVIEYEGNVSEILQEHDMVLNTSGEREISDIFGNKGEENQNELKVI